MNQDTFYTANVSRGKDSTAMLLAIKELGWTLDEVVAVDVWATKTIPAELPSMVAFKEEWDRKCLEKFGIPVTRLCAMRNGEILSYKDLFYAVNRTGNRAGDIRGWPILNQPWCNSYLKRDVLNKHKNALRRTSKNVVTYIGIAKDEEKRVKRWEGRKEVLLPLVEIGWTEKECKEIARDLGMLAPTYETGERDGCWMCHNQRIGKLRETRKQHPDLWKMMLEWDADTKPNSKFSPKHTLHDFDRRFELEDAGLVDVKGFKWTDMEMPCRQMTIYDFIKEER